MNIRHVPRALLAVAPATLLGAASLAWAAPASAQTVVVHPGQSIQAAVDHARPGDTVRLAPGIYRQSVAITRDDITLTGEGPARTIIEPSPTPTGPCASQEFGVCVVGQVDDNGDVTRPVTDVRVTSLSIDNFSTPDSQGDPSGAGIFILGARHTTVDHVVMSGNGSFGVVSVFSASDQWFDDSASGSAEAGFHVSLTVGPGARLSHDRALGNRYGILIASARGGTITGNRLTGNCSGIALSGEGLSGAASTSAWRVTGNLSASNDLACPPAGAEPGVSGNGITLWGVRDIVVAGNTVLDNRPSEPSVIAGGIVVKTSQAGDAPADINVVGNILAGNKPADLVWDGSGSDVSFETNVCVTSTPPGFCR